MRIKPLLYLYHFLNSSMTSIIFTLSALQMISQATVITKLLYALSGWWCFATSDDRRRIEQWWHQEF